MLQQAVQQDTIKHGDTGPGVEHLQRSLTDLNYSPGTIDGVFGFATERAVKNFQATHGLHIDGIVGPNTWAALEMATKAKSATNWLRKYWYVPVIAVGLFAWGRKT